MAIRRIATTRQTKNYAVLVEGGRGRYTLTASDLQTHDTASKVRAELERLAGAANETLPRLFVHRNRDGSFAVATGAAPTVWPEDRRLPGTDEPTTERRGG